MKARALQMPPPSPSKSAALETAQATLSSTQNGTQQDKRVPLPIRGAFTFTKTTYANSGGNSGREGISVETLNSNLFAPARATAQKIMKDNLQVAATSDLAKQLSAGDLRTKAVSTLERCLFAENKFYDLGAKKMVTSPDFKTQLGAALAILSYTDGKPVERREIITRTVASLEELRAQAKRSPELRRAISELLDEKPVSQTPQATDNK